MLTIELVCSANRALGVVACLHIRGCSQNGVSSFPIKLGDSFEGVLARVRCRHLPCECLAAVERCQPLKDLWEPKLFHGADLTSEGFIHLVGYNLLCPPTVVDRAHISQIGVGYPGPLRLLRRWVYTFKDMNLTLGQLESVHEAICRQIDPDDFKYEISNHKDEQGGRYVGVFYRDFMLLRVPLDSNWKREASIRLEKEYGFLFIPIGDLPGTDGYESRIQGVKEFCLRPPKPPLSVLVDDMYEL